MGTSSGHQRICVTQPSDSALDVSLLAEMPSLSVWTSATSKIGPARGQHDLQRVRVTRCHKRDKNQLEGAEGQASSTVATCPAVKTSHSPARASPSFRNHALRLLLVLLFVFFIRPQLFPSDLCPLVHRISLPLLFGGNASADPCQKS